MTRKLAIVTSAILLGSMALGVMPGQAAERTAAVPLPVARPALLSPSLLAENVPTPAPAPALQPDGTGMKSGSTEAIAVQLEGAKVLSAEGNVIGDVERVIERPGGPAQAVLGIGGFLGIGERRVLVPAESLSPSGNGLVRADLSEDQIRALPVYAE